MTPEQSSDTCPNCTRLQRYADTAWNRGHTMGMKANEDTARQAMDALKAEKAAHADTNANLTATLLEAERERDAAREALRQCRDWIADRRYGEEWPDEDLFYGSQRHLIRISDVILEAKP